MAPDAIVAALGGRRNGRCPCPICGARRSVSVDIGRDGKALVHCHSNSCDVWAWLRAHGAAPQTNQRSGNSKSDAGDWVSPEQHDADRLRRAVVILRAAAMANAGKPDKYLHARGIDSVPDCAMFMPSDVSTRVLGKRYPAMVSPVLGSRGLVGAQTTLLTKDGTGRIKDQKKSYGPIRGGYVPLGKPDPDRPLLIGEGIETTLAAMQITGLPGIATLGTSGMKTVNVPACSEVIVLSDTDEQGREAAEILAERVIVQRPVRIATPRAGDWNDQLKRADGDPTLLTELKRKIIKAKHFKGAPRLRALTREEFEALDIPDMQHFLAPILPVAGATVLSGQKGNGKTRLVLSIAEAIATGGVLLDWQSERPGKVLYIDGELPGRTIKLRLSRLKPTNGQLYVVSRYQQLEAGVRMGKLTSQELRNEIDRLVEEEGINVVILDSFSSLVGESENDIEYWPAIEDWIMEHRGRGRSVLLIMHEGIAMGRARGLTKIRDQFDNIMRVEAVKDRNEVDPDNFYFLIEQGPIRDETAMRFKPRQVVSVPRAGHLDWEFVEVPEKAVRGRPRNEDRDKEIERLHDDGLSPAEIGKKLGMSKRAVYYALKHQGVH